MYYGTLNGKPKTIVTLGFFLILACEGKIKRCVTVLSIS